MLTYRDLSTALRKLDLGRSRPAIAHASLSAFGQVQGGAETVVGALLAACPSLIMPGFTYATMVIPEVGPPDNASSYGSGKDKNRMAEFYRPDMPADRIMGAVAEAIRKHPRACRSNHPILSFTGVNSSRALDAQTIAEPLAPIRVLEEMGAWVLLLGVDHTVNTSIHYAEAKAGRKGFKRWALTSRGVVECPGFPGCSDGFQALAPRLGGVTRRVQAGETQIQAIPLIDLIDIAELWIKIDPTALLCNRAGCERCNTYRKILTRTHT